MWIPIENMLFVPLIHLWFPDKDAWLANSPVFQELTQENENQTVMVIVQGWHYPGCFLVTRGSDVTKLPKYVNTEMINEKL